MRPSEHPAFVRVTPAFLRGRPLPAPGESKRSRGDVVVLGGAARAPGAARLAGLAALRVGAGRLTLAIGSSAATAVAVAVPESGVVPLEQTASGSVTGRAVAAAAHDLQSADAVLVGPGLDDVAETRRMLRRLTGMIGPDATLVLDAYALGAVAGRDRLARTRKRILTPNPDEAELLLGRRSRDLDTELFEIARRYRAVVSCQGIIAEPGGTAARVDAGGPGLGTSGSGDALAGAIAGLAARGCEPFDAAAWGTYLHAAAGDALARDISALGFVASEIVDRLPYELAAVERG